MVKFLEQVKMFLLMLDRGEAEIPEAVIEEFGENCKKLLRARNTKKQEFSIRMSSIGRPLCQQQMEKAGEKREASSYSFPMKMIYGDMIEAAALAIMKAAKVNVQEQQTGVSLDIADGKIDGTLDVVIDGELYDIKSCSPYSFSSKFNAPDGFSKLVADDPFGYVAQGYLYSDARKVPFGGWIALDKVSGEWAVLGTPIADNSYRRVAVEKATENYTALKTDAPFKRCFDTITEEFNGKATGNKYLGMACGYCSFKDKCWGKVTLAPQPKSKAKNPKRFWYVGEVHE